MEYRFEVVALIHFIGRSSSPAISALTLALTLATARMPGQKLGAGRRPGTSTTFDALSYRRWYGRSASEITLLEEAAGADAGQTTMYISRLTPTVTSLSPTLDKRRPSRSIL